MTKIEQHMGRYASPSRFGEKPVEFLVTGPNLIGAVCTNMKSRVVRRAADPESMKKVRNIDDFYDYHVADDNAILMVVEAQTNPQNSTIAPSASRVDPTRKRTLWVKPWVDFGISVQGDDSGRAFLFAASELDDAPCPDGLRHAQMDETRLMHICDGGYLVTARGDVTCLLGAEATWFACAS